MRPIPKRRARNRWTTIASGLLIALFLIMGSLSCDTLLLPPEPEEPVYDNPIDPGNPAYVAPQTTITGGPAQGSTISQNSATFTWSGNATGMLFQYRLNASQWSPWAGDLSVLLQYLDEAPYTFEVRGAYNPGVGNTPTLIDDTPASRSFTVNAVTGPALRLSPTLTLTSVNDTFDLNLIAEDVSDLMMVSTVIRFNTARQQVVSLTNGSFLTSTGGSIAVYNTYDNDAGVIEVNMATATGSPPGVSGTGTVLTIRFRQINAEDGLIWFAAGSSVMRDSDNDPITITATPTVAVVVR